MVSQDDRERWNERYTAGSHVQNNQPCTVLAEHIQYAPTGHALDVACGAGRNALYLAQQGFSVDALDISDVGIELGARAARENNLTIAWACTDLLRQPRLPRDDYALILMCHFIAPELLARLPAHLQPGGILMLEQHLAWPESENTQSSRYSGPRSNRFRVAPGSLLAGLLAAAPELEQVSVQEGLFEQNDGRIAAVSRLVLRKPPI